MSAARLRLLTRVLGGLLTGEFQQAFRPREKGASAEQRARRVRLALESLGPFWIKVGQILATRPDIVPSYVIPELTQLQDRADVLPFSRLEPVLRREFGPRWPALFRDIDTRQPLGAASLAQVYRATMPGVGPVVVKIQRPGVREVVSQDMALLRRASRIIGRVAPRFNAVMDVEAMLGILFDAMRPELDFTNEARNMRRARELVTAYEHLAVPEPHTVTPTVLVQTLAPGTSVGQADHAEFDPAERLAIGRDLLLFLYRGFFVDRFFHADPHPGNVFVAPGEPATLIDWGMVGRVDRRTSMLLVLILLTLAQNDGHGLATTWIELGNLTAWAQQAAFMSDMAALVPGIADSSLEDLNFGQTLSRILTCSSRRGIRTHPSVAILGKSFANMEGSVRRLAPELSAVDVFREGLSSIMVSFAAETASREQVARALTELFLGTPGVVGQLRGILRDLAGAWSASGAGQGPN